MIDRLLERFGQGERLALARLLTRVSRGQDLLEISRRLSLPAAPARVVAITGSGGVGKSSLLGKLLPHIRQSGSRVAVLACDPQSPISGGALLGDRVRMPSQPEDEGVFIRSLASGFSSGPLAEHLSLMVRLCEAFGFDIIVVETAGAGQGDTAVHNLADVLVLLLQPETGDELQWEKAGVFEVADILVVHKADLPGADRVQAQVRAALELSGSTVPVLLVSARSGEGMEALWQAIQSCPLRRRAQGSPRELLELGRETLAARFARALAKPELHLQELLGQWQQGLLSDEEAGAAVLLLLAKESP